MTDPQDPPNRKPTETAQESAQEAEQNALANRVFHAVSRDPDVVRQVEGIVAQAKEGVAATFSRKGYEHPSEREELLVEALAGNLAGVQVVRENMDVFRPSSGVWTEETVLEAEQLCWGRALEHHDDAPCPFAVEFYRDAAGEMRWRVRRKEQEEEGEEGEIVGKSSEGYQLPAGFERAIANAYRVALALVIELVRSPPDFGGPVPMPPPARPDTLEFYQDEAELWRWRVKASNGRILGASDEGYPTRRSAASNAGDVGPGILPTARLALLRSLHPLQTPTRGGH